jgi:hypothetical protein
LRHQVRHVLAARGAFLGELRHAGRVGIKHHAAVATAQQAPHNVSAHPPQANHSELHGVSFNKNDFNKIVNVKAL